MNVLLYLLRGRFSLADVALVGVCIFVRINYGLGPTIVVFVILMTNLVMLEQLVGVRHRRDHRRGRKNA